MAININHQTNDISASDGVSNISVNGLAVDSIPSSVLVSGTTQTAEKSKHYILTNGSATTITLPTSPVEGTTVWITPTNGLTTNIVARNGQTIMGVSEDLTLNIANQTVMLRFLNSSWRIL